MMSKKNFDEKRIEMIQSLISQGILSSREVIRAMKTVHREDFLPQNLKEYTYKDIPLPIGFGQTISAPHMVAIMAEALKPKAGDKILEIGAGSGYNAAVLAEIVCPKDNIKSGHIYTMEIIPEIADFAINNLEKTGYGKKITVICKDGSIGLPDHAPYDGISVTAAAPKVPEVLVKQINLDGLLLIPVGSLNYSQELLLIKKVKNGKISIKNLGGVAFVPLTGKYGWKL